MVGGGLPSLPITGSATAYHGAVPASRKLGDNSAYTGEPRLFIHSFIHALFVVSQVADYFLCHGNSVYLASLDASKAFNRVNHVKLFNKVIDRGLPGNIVKILIDWYCL